MRLCFPVTKDEGLVSPIFAHFGSAPVFLVVDSGTGEVAQVIRRSLEQSHGASNPLRTLEAGAVDAVVVTGIGGGAWMGLKTAGIDVLEAKAETVEGNVALFRAGALSRWNPSPQLR